MFRVSNAHRLVNNFTNNFKFFKRFLNHLKVSRLTFFLASGANSQGTTEEHLCPLYLQLTARRTSKGGFCLISYNRQREQSNNPSF